MTTSTNENYNFNDINALEPGNTFSYPGLVSFFDLG